MALQRLQGSASQDLYDARLKMATDHIRYDLLVQDALRSVVRKVLADTARSGLPGDHHFNIAFKTRAPGVVVPASLRSRFPDEMSIILQHEFFELIVTSEAFEVTLNFSRKPERLAVPFNAITGFTDPSVPFGFKLEPKLDETLIEGKPESTPASRPSAAPPVSVKPTEAPLAKTASKEAEPTSEPKVVSIDAFRKK